MLIYFLKTSTAEYITSPFFGWFMGIVCIILLLLPREATKSLGEWSARHKTWKTNLISTYKTKVVYEDSNRNFWISKIAVLIILTYCVILLLNHYNILDIK